MRRHSWVLAVGALTIAGCGSGSDSGAPADDPVDDAASDDSPDLEQSVEDLDEADDLEEAVDDLVDDLEAVQASEGGGGATFTANGQTWEFSSVLCAFGEDQIGQAGAVFNLSAIADGVQLYASIDDAGAAHSLSLNDIEDFENPSVSISISPFFTDLLGAPTEFLVLDGTSVSADVPMMDDLTSQPIDGNAQLSATCP